MQDKHVQALKDIVWSLRNSRFRADEAATMIENVIHEMESDEPPDPIADRLFTLERRQQEDSGIAQGLAIDLAATNQRLVNLAHAMRDRLGNLAHAMREVARKESVHASVRFLADTIALNLAEPVSPPPGYTIRKAAGGYVWRCGDRNSPIYMTPEKAVDWAWVDHEARRD